MRFAPFVGVGAWARVPSRAMSRARARPNPAFCAPVRRRRRSRAATACGPSTSRRARGFPGLVRGRRARSHDSSSSSPVARGCACRRDRGAVRGAPGSRVLRRRRSRDGSRRAARRITRPLTLLAAGRRLRRHSSTPHPRGAGAATCRRARGIAGLAAPVAPLRAIRTVYRRESRTRACQRERGAPRVRARMRSTRRRGAVVDFGRDNDARLAAVSRLRRRSMRLCGAALASRRTSGSRLRLLS